MTYFLQCHWGTGGRVTQILLLHLVSHYILCMGMPALPWEKLSFESKVFVTCSSIGCSNWLTVSLHHISVPVCVLTAEDIDAPQVGYPSMEIMRVLSINHTDFDALRVWKKI